MNIKIKKMDYPMAQTKAIEAALIELGIEYEISGNEYIAVFKEKLRLTLETVDKDTVSKLKEKNDIDSLIDKWANDIWNNDYAKSAMNNLINDMNCMIYEYIDEELSNGNL